MSNSDNLGLLERILKMIKEYGAMRIVEAILLLSMFAGVMYITVNLDKIFERVFREQVDSIEKEQQDEHDRAVLSRRYIREDMNHILKASLDEFDADRAFVVEMHNGNNNMSGLPFIYGEMTYEVSDEDSYDIDEEYSSINLSRFDLCYYLMDHDIWIGTVDELDTIDKKMSYRLRANETKYLCLIGIHGVENDIGFYGFSYTRDVSDSIDRTSIVKGLLKNSQKAAALLDKNYDDYCEVFKQ